MIDLYDHFFEKLIFEDIAGSEVNRPIGLSLVTPSTRVVPTENSKNFTIELPNSLKEVYKQIEFISLSWHISPAPTDENQDIPLGLKDDTYLKETYWDEGYEWGVIHEYLSGAINIQKLEDMLNPEFCKEYIFDGVINGLNSEDFMPFDLHWNIMACLKKENGRILDNVWIVYYEAEEMYNMEVTIDKYMELCYKAKGFYDWQLAYIFKNGEHYELMKRYLPMLFPHLKLDLADFGIKN